MTDQSGKDKSGKVARSWCPIDQDKVTLFKFESKGDYVTGYYIGCQHNVGKYNSNLHQALTSKGIVKFWGSYLLDYKLSSIITGLFVKIVFEGEQQNPEANSKIRIYTVEVDSERYKSVLCGEAPF